MGLIRASAETNDAAIWLFQMSANSQAPAFLFELDIVVDKAEIRETALCDAFVVGRKEGVVSRRVVNDDDFMWYTDGCGNIVLQGKGLV